MLEITMPLPEIVLRASLMYIALVLVLRLIPKRNTGHIAPNDMLTLILIGAMATDAIMDGTTSMADILLMTGVILAWACLLDLLEYRFPALRRLLHARQATLVDNGRMVRPNMRRELVTEEELMAALRKEGIDDVADVRSACLEANGEISIIARDKTGRVSAAERGAQAGGS